MSDSMLVCDSHSWVRLGVRRQLQNGLSLLVESCTVGELDEKMRSNPRLLILGVQDEVELARALTLYRQHRKHMKFVLLLSEDRRSSARLFFPTAGLVSRERLPESLLVVVRSLMRGAAVRPLSHRTSLRPRTFC